MFINCRNIVANSEQNRIPIDKELKAAGGNFETRFSIAHFVFAIERDTIKTTITKITLDIILYGGRST